jgi:hypothetical protein
VWKQTETLEWKFKGNVAPVLSEMVRALAQEEGAATIAYFFTFTVQCMQLLIDRKIMVCIFMY